MSDVGHGTGPENHWADYALVSYAWELGKPPDNLRWPDVNKAFIRVIERAKAAEEAEQRES